MPAREISNEENAALEGYAQAGMDAMLAVAKECIGRNGSHEEVEKELTLGMGKLAALLIANGSWGDIADACKVVVCQAFMLSIVADLGVITEEIMEGAEEGAEVH